MQIKRLVIQFLSGTNPCCLGENNWLFSICIIFLSRIVIHNLKGYDGHLIVKSSKSEIGKVRVIPQNVEKVLSLTVGQLQFIDSFQFTSQSL